MQRNFNSRKEIVMRAIICLAFALFAAIFAASQELQDEERRNVHFSQTNNHELATDLEEHKTSIQERQVQHQQLQASIAALSARKDALLQEHNQRFENFNAQLQKDSQEHESWFATEKKKRLAIIQTQLFALDERDKEARRPFEDFINRNPKADVRREKFDLQFYLGEIARSRRGLTDSVCSDLYQSRDSRQKAIDARFAALKTQQIAAYNVENERFERELAALRIQLFGLQLALSEVDNSMQNNG